MRQRVPVPGDIDRPQAVRASSVSKGVQYTEPADNQAMNALLKDVVKLEEQLQDKGLGHI